MATTYRLTEHFHYWTKHARLNAIMQPEQFVEIGEDAREGERHRGRRQGQGVAPSAGIIKAVAVVTKRIRPLTSKARRCTRSACRSTGASTGVAKPGYPRQHADALVGDANSQTPEFKSFLVKVEKA